GGSDDDLLIRTVRWACLKKKDQVNFIEKPAGSHASVDKWLRKRDVAVMDSDGVNDAMPSNVEGKLNPLHELVLVGLGMPLLDNLDLETLAAEARQRNRWEFL